MHDAGLDVEGAVDRDRLGVYVGSGVGGMQTLVDNVHTIADRRASSRIALHDCDDDSQHGFGQHCDSP